MKCEIRIREADCLRCGRCARVCPSAVFAAGKGEVPKVGHSAGCIGCGHCVDVCSAGCIEHSLFPQERIHEVDRGRLPRPDQLMELIRSRRSNRTFTAEPVPAEALADMLEAARYAPTAENSRRVSVTVIAGAERLQAVEDATMHFFLRLAKVLMSSPVRPITKLLLRDLYDEAPELVRFEARWKAGRRPCLCNCTTLLAFSAPADYDFAMHDCNLAYQNASLMGEAHGVSQVYMGLVWTALKYMGKARTRRLLGLPEGHRLCALMGIGMPAFRYLRYTER